MLMEKGHIELGEILFVALLAIGLATALIILVDGNGNKAAIPTSADNAPQNDTPPLPPADWGYSANSADNRSAAAVPPQVTNKSTGALVDEGLAHADLWFNSTGPMGNFDINTFGWAMGLANSTPDSIPIKEKDLRAVEVRFNGRYDDALRAFAFRYYTSPTLSEYPRLYAIAIFISNSTLVDRANQTFDIQYDPYPEGPQILEGCSVLNSTMQTSAGGSPVKIYDITCKIMYGVYP
jgi:hypothetical protein